MALLNEINVKGVPHPIVTDDGYYQEMTVGDAEQLVATTFTEDDAPYNFRTAGGAIDIGDRKQVEGLVGGTVAWNQLMRPFTSDYWNVDSGASGTLSGTSCSFTASQQGKGVTLRTANNILLLNGHNYLLIFDIKSASDTTDIRVRFAGGAWDANVSPTTSWTTYSKVMKRASDATGYYYIVDRKTENFVQIDVRNLMVIDLTQMFGSTIADYIYSLEQANAGAGVAWFKKLFPKPYYEYNSRQLMSVKALRHITRGFNAWDEEWVNGYYNQASGAFVSSANFVACKNLIPILPNTGYYVNIDAIHQVLWYDAEQNFISANTSLSVPHLYTSPTNAHYMAFYVGGNYGTTYKNDICINLHWDGERDGEYEEYKEHVYELDPDLELRGIPKLSAGNDLYFDGDMYEPDGTVTRKMYEMVFDGSENFWSEYPSKETEWCYAVGIFEGKVPKRILAWNWGICNNMACVPNIASGEYVGAISTSSANNGKNLYVAFPSGITSLSAFKTWLGNNNMHLVYELAEPTEESAGPYNGTQIVDDFGTEEFVDAEVEAGDRDVAIPVGHNSLYQPNLRAKVEMAPESPEDDGYYVVYHHDGINEYVPLIIPQELPELPSEDGTYTLKCTVASGSATLSFESEV